jgi:predicted Ser/Thr protein kinase
LNKETPPSLRALGRRSLPTVIEVEGRTYAQRRVFKNDFFAATALYEGPTGKVILKVQRQASFLLLPLGWVGRLLAAREAAALQRLSDVPGVPRLIGRWGKTGIVREYIAGRTLSPKEHVPDDFHEQLRALIAAIHAKDMAYVDLEKCENVLVGEDGRPYLFDFQIAWFLPRRWGGNLQPATAFRRWLQAGDRYHLIKLQRRTRPDQLTPEALAVSYRKPWFVRVHHVVTRPFTRVRRAVLNRVDPKRKNGERGRIDENEVIGAVQQCP